MVGYLLDITLKTRDKNKTPVEIGTFIPGCAGDGLALNYPDDDTKYHGLNDAFDLSTMDGKPGVTNVDNITLSVEAYGELKGPAHPPIVKLGGEALVFTNVTDLPADLAVPNRPGNFLMWAATYPCNNF